MSALNEGLTGRLRRHASDDTEAADVHHLRSGAIDRHVERIVSGRLHRNVRTGVAPEQFEELRVRILLVGDGVVFESAALLEQVEAHARRELARSVADLRAFAVHALHRVRHSLFTARAVVLKYLGTKRRN